jgi:AcrR family transcriptional regulator
MVTSAPTTARARARAELTSEIKAAARRQLEESGPSSLSLRAVARELGMVSSAVYRYFASRDVLLTALIVDAYDAVGDAAERALAASRPGVTPRWLAVGRAVRSWALANPHDYALVYGSPVPGYKAPHHTIPPALRVNLVALAIVGDGVRSGEIVTGGEGPVIPRVVRSDLAAIRDAYVPAVPDEVLARALFAWTQLFGTISFELFGHLHNVIHDYDAFFDVQMRQGAELLVTGFGSARRG